MKILYVVPYVPSLIRTRPYNLIRALHQRGHQVTLACLTEKQDADELAAIQPAVETVVADKLPKTQAYGNCLAALPTQIPLQAAYTWQPRLAERLRDLILHPAGEKPYDIIQVEHLRGVRYAEVLRAIPGAPPIVWDSVDSITHLFRQSVQSHPSALRRAFLKFELARTENYEAHMARAFSRVLVTSLKDQQVFNQLAPGAPLTIIPNGVDLAYFSPPSEPQDDYDPDAIVISGKMSYHPNVAMVLYFVREILPLIWKRRPQTKLWVVGQNPSEEIRAACADERINVTGRVDDIRPYLQRAAVAATPITYGAGIQNKVLEALACATPVVASPLAISALQIHPEEEILVGADSATFAAQVLRILDQPALRNRLGAAGRQFVQQEHSWDAAAAQLEQVYQAVVSH